MRQTRWWKCDFQVATPAWDFKFTGTHNLSTEGGKEAFLDAYMAALKAKSIEVIALADHNTGDWIDRAKQAGLRNGVHVFPGCEITTGTGEDGAHLLIIGSTEKTSQDFDRLLYGPLGFGDEHPPFLMNGGKRVPASSPRTLIQILDALPDDFLAIAPHVLNQNGIASTTKGDIRWKALHHERLVAIDPGSCVEPNLVGETFQAKFRRRDLSNFPRLPELAFVSTSDSYSFEQFGSRFTWVRMGEISVEALRQAFLDHESRVLCDWSPLLGSFPDRNPNNVRHAWIAHVNIAGQLTNSNLPLEVPLHPNMNVVIGGRGSGKSTIVAAIRALYSSTAGLPRRLEEEANTFVSTVFAGAQITGKHHVQESQELQAATWTLSAGSITTVADASAPTTFQATVVSQKELFERAAGDKSDPHLSSRSLLSLLDGSIGYSAEDQKTIGSFGRRLDDARTAWAQAVRQLVQLQQDIAQLPGLRQQLSTLRGQVEAFSSPEVKTRLARIAERSAESKVLASLADRTGQAIEDARALADRLVAPTSGLVPSEQELALSFSDNVGLFSAASVGLSDALKAAAARAQVQLDDAQQKVVNSVWQKAYEQSQEDLAAYKLELEAKGLSTTEFTRIQSELHQVASRVTELDAKLPELEAAQEASERTWDRVQAAYQERRAARQQLLDEIAERSGRLRFKVQSSHDFGPWAQGLRAAGSFRADAYLDDVPALGKWLWQCSEEEKSKRTRLWRDALATGNMQPLQVATGLRPALIERMAKFDSALRLRLATHLPDDVVHMEFLKDGADPSLSANWQPITEGSPGQRTAAMLAFVLHHGREPLVLDQPEDDLDSEWISNLVVKELRKSRWNRQLIVISHNANIPVLGDAEQVIALENRDGSLRIRRSQGVQELELHVGPVENRPVREDIQTIMEGGVAAFMRREQKYNNETKQYKASKGS